jgi:S-adenosylmethionine-diacylgycerolhomoserine-N-methlytransferase
VTSSPQAASSADRDSAAHVAFLDRYYGATHRVYDLSRKYYLFGRDTALAQLLKRPWSTLLEVGPGTGRNLAWLHRRRPEATFGGLEASGVMLAHAARRCPWARIERGFAEDGDLSAVLGQRPERILISYSLSMFRDPGAAIANARRHLAPDGELWVVDFSDLASVPSLLGAGLRRFLAAFHVAPVQDALLRAHGATSLQHGPGRYFVIARFAATPS